MNIIQAINLAKESRKAIRRKEWVKGGIGIIPTNSDSLGVFIFKDNGKKGTRHWNPSAGDLIAEDWECI